MPDKLSVYNGALRVIGERRLGSLTENREPRRLLDDAWDDDFLNAVLEAGQWNFAARTSKFTYSQSVTPDFGYTYAFEKPSDWIRTMGVAADEYLRAPIFDYEDSQQYWWVDYQEIYVRYVSNDATYGLDLSLWPKSFTSYVEHALAEEIVMPLTQSETKAKELERKTGKALIKARSMDAMNQPTQFPPAGRFLTARLGGFAARRRER